ncbi:MAG: O-methyltransferase [Flavobacteriia bacterium]|jgi:predicted O-methyltransferase YrrM|nr:O-methyltransferase [Flavobacteriia bacterium]
MEFIAQGLADYANAHSTVASSLLQRIERETHLEVLQPRMLSGPFQGRLLSLISKLVQPKRILEIGTYTGYSALCLAEGLTKEGKIITLDVNEELHKRVQGYFNASDYSEHIDYRIGDALDLIPALNETWDLVFIDADKKNYLNYYDLVVDRVRSGGLILADNVLWSGKVIDEKAQDKETVLLRQYNERINHDERVENILLPIRDGIMVARKK